MDQTNGSTEDQCSLGPSAADGRASGAGAAGSGAVGSGEAGRGEAADDGAADRLESAPAVEGETVSRVALTPDALALLRQLIERHGPLMFHQSGGCRDGSSPMCYRKGTFRTGGADVLLGTFTLPDVPEDAAELEFWMSAEQFDLWKHTHLTVHGRGGGFSLEVPEGKRFLIRSDLLD